MKTAGDFNYYLDNESKTIDEIRKLVDTTMTVSVNGLDVHYFSPKEKYSNWKKEFNSLMEECLKFNHPDLENTKQFLKSCTIPMLKECLIEFKNENFLKFNKTEKALKEAEQHQKQNGGILQGGEFPFDSITKDYKRGKVVVDFVKVEKTKHQNNPIIKREIIDFLDVEDYALKNGFSEYHILDDYEETKFYNYLNAKETYDNLYEAEKRLENTKKENKGQKHNEGKLPIDIMLTVQFPKAIQAICKATLFGHEKYKETDKDWLNYKRVNGGSTTYANAGQRHNFNKSGKDEQSGLPHIIHKCWNAMAELELWIEENKYE